MILALNSQNVKKCENHFLFLDNKFGQLSFFMKFWFEKTHPYISSFPLPRIFVLV